MRFVSYAVFAVLAFVFALALGPTYGSAAQNDLVARGKYLVNDAGKCTDCHGAKLQGQKLDFLKPGMPVLYAAPKIAGLPQLSAADATAFLQTAKLPNGKPATPPMPEYHFNAADASAIVAYLKSLR
ncbi:MAG: c-type cytochrome [Candidatus Eremiobacteraeota bacterium]|nr:c-type cytochrome [Candidatus Eremiobacteraeota bacterium]